MKVSYSKFIWDQLTTTTPPVVEENLEGKTIVVTGANIGVGFEAAKYFARMGAGKLILACRDQSRGEEALAKIREETGHKNIELYILDLASFASVKTFADKFKNQESRLDILVENAAVGPNPASKPTEDSWEQILQVNHIATSLLALELLPILVETAKIHGTTPRLVVVSSESHYMTTISREVISSPNPLRFLGMDEDYNAKYMSRRSRYPVTKLLNLLFVRALNERLQQKSIIVNAPNPGLCYSGLRRHVKDLGLRVVVVVWVMERLLARTTEEGSRQIIWAAIGHEDKKDELRGAYLSMSEVTEPSDFVISEEGRVAQDKLWDNLIDELIKIDPELKNVVRDYFK